MKVLPEQWDAWCYRFRTFGFDPYNSVDDIDTYNTVKRGLR